MSDFIGIQGQLSPIRVKAMFYADLLEDKNPREHAIPRGTRNVTILINKDAGRMVKIDLGVLGWVNWARRLALGAFDRIYVVD